jgi:hypothetical protein
MRQCAGAEGAPEESLRARAQDDAVRIAELDAEENKFGAEIDKAGMEGDNVINQLLKLQQEQKAASAKP